MTKKLWCVKREVYAETLEKAIHTKGGRVFEVVELLDQKETKRKEIGFKK